MPSKFRQGVSVLVLLFCAFYVTCAEERGETHVADTNANQVAGDSLSREILQNPKPASAPEADGKAGSQVSSSSPAQTVPPAETDLDEGGSVEDSVADANEAEATVEDILAGEGDQRGDVDVAHHHPSQGEIAEGHDESDLDDVEIMVEDFDASGELSHDGDDEAEENGAEQMEVAASAESAPPPAVQKEDKHVSGEAVTPVDEPPEVDEGLLKEIDDLLMEAEKATYGDDPSYPVNYARGMECLDKAERLGSHEAIYKKGLIHQYGLGVEANETEARLLFETAADKGDAHAQASLGFMYGSGVGVEQNDAKAVLYLYFAAMGGSPVGQLAMGYRHLHGIGVQQSCPTAALYYQPAAEITVQDHKEAGTPSMVDKIRLDDDVDFRTVRNGEDDDIIQYYQYAADKGDVNAQMAMGQLYFFGARGVTQNYERAHQYFQNAAQQGHAQAHSHLGHLYAQGSGVPADNSTALKHFQSGAEKGDAASENGLGFMYLHGSGVEKNVEQALSYFKKAADKGNAEAQFHLGTMYVSGNGVSFDPSKALTYFTMATQQGHIISLFNVGAMHLNGLGTGQSCQHAVQYLKTVAERGPWSIVFKDAHKYMRQDKFQSAFVSYMKMAEMGYEVAQHNSGWLLDRGFVESPRNDTSFRFFSMAAEQGNVGAQVKIGNHYYTRNGGDEDFIKAAAHYRAASDMRNAEAAYNIGFMHEHGLGLPKDWHLAKRHYDLAIEYSEDAYVPVTIALYKLKVNMYLSDQGHPSIEEILAMYEWDTWAIAGLSTLLCLLITVRALRVRD